MTTDSNVYIFFFEELGKSSHRTQIQFSNFFVSFIGSSCSFSHLRLLLFSFCYYYFFHIAITFLPFLLFSLYYYYFSFYYYYCFPIFIVISLLVFFFKKISPLFFPIADIFFTWCCSFHVMKSFNYLII